jgi:serine/threonine-protein kinase
LELLQRFRTAIADRYRIERELGVGGMATVYLAEDVRHGRQVALKLLKPELAAVLGGERFLREIHIAASLSHPHILPLYDSGEADGLLYYVMPYVAGESLRQCLERQTQFAIDEAIEITRQVAAALDYAHRQGVVHRDIKPENILLQEGQAVVADFGIARALREAGGERLTETGLSLGTPQYMSPEQASGVQELDGRTDIYALAAVLYEMLAGEPPFTGPTGQAVIARQLVDPVPSLRTVRPTVPEQLERAIEKALAKVPADRYSTAGAFVEAAGAAAEIEIVPTRERRALVRDQRRRKVFRLLVPALAGAVVAVAAVAAWLLWPRVPTLDPTLIAVAPFDVIGMELESWREDAPTLLYSRLDGAGRWRAIPPSVVRAQWTERADAATATDLARTVGAGLVLFGHVVSTGNDSVQLEATLFDAVAGRTIYQFRESGPVAPMVRLADAATVEVMAALSRDYVPPSIRWTSFGTSHPDAIKAFLKGEEHYRGFRMDSAKAYYEQAVAHDSGFALAWRRLAYATEKAPNPERSIYTDMWCGRWGSADDLRLRAGTQNHGLAERESLLVAIDSQWAAARRANHRQQGGGRLPVITVGSRADSLYQRLLGTLQAARATYLRDPELLFLLGEVQCAVGAWYGTPLERAQEALASAVALDSGFIPAYLHLPELDFFLRGRQAGARTLQAYVDHAPEGPHAGAYQLVLDLLRGDERSDALAVARLDSLLEQRGLITQRDEVFTFARNLVLWARSPKVIWMMEEGAIVGEGQDNDALIAVHLMMFGRVREAYELATSRWGPNIEISMPHVTLAPLGLVPRDSSRRYLAGAAAYRPLPEWWAGPAIRWWLELGDSLSLRNVVEGCEAELGSDSLEEARASVLALIATTARAHLTLLRGDSAAALAELERYRWCGGATLCFPPAITVGELFAAAGRIELADAILGYAVGAGWPGLPIIEAALARGRVNERAGNRDRAIWSYQLVLDLWGDGDPEVQPWVEEARAGLARVEVER